MQTIFKGKQISGILGILPESTFSFDDEIKNYPFPEKQSKKLKKIMGYESHCLAKESSTASDFCIYGLKCLIENGKVKKEEIGAIVVVTLSPDYFVPHISSIIHGEFGFSEDVVCMDLSQGCCGYLQGLMQSFMLLDYMDNKKVLLFNTDVLSHKVSSKDRNEYPLIGDATTISVIENNKDVKDIIFSLFTDGGRRDALIIPAGGFAVPSSVETAIVKKEDDENYRSLNDLHMNGMEIFDFVQTKVPPMIEQLFLDYNICKDDINYYLFHQPNKFMLKKLAEELNVTDEKMFMNIVENYGNSSGATIPINIVHNLSKLVIKERYNCCLSAFGSGLSWGAAVMEIGNMDFCEMIRSDL